MTFTRIMKLAVCVAALVAFAFLCRVAFGVPPLKDPAYVAHLIMMAGGGGGGGGSYDLEETFDTNPGFDGPGWTLSGDTGTIDPDHTATVLQGTESLHFAGNTGFTFCYTNLPSLSDEWNIKVMYRSSVIGQYEKVTLSRIGVANDFTFEVENDGKVLAMHGGSSTMSAASEISVDTTYYIWCRWVKGSGANGIYQVWINTSDSKPGTPVIDANDGAGVNQPTAVSFEMPSAAGADVTWDHLRLKTTAFD